MKLRKLIITVCALALSLNIALPVHGAANADLDLEAHGSITVTMKRYEKAVTGSEWTAYRVGEVKNEDWNLSWIPVESLQAAFTEEDFQNISSSGFRDRLEEAVKGMEKKPQGWVSEEISPGRYRCGGDEGLPLGLYLMMQTKTVEGYWPSRPFLVTMPQSEGETWIYDVDAISKLEIIPASKSPDDPENPEDPSNPADQSTLTDQPLIQTGQLNWPVPVLAGLGLALLLLGRMVRRSGRQCG